LLNFGGMINFGVLNTLNSLLPKFIMKNFFSYRVAIMSLVVGVGMTMSSFKTSSIPVVTGYAEQTSYQTGKITGMEPVYFTRAAVRFTMAVGHYVVDVTKHYTPEVARVTAEMMVEGSKFDTRNSVKNKLVQEKMKKLG
jgi:hypothetical protein